LQRLSTLLAHQSLAGFTLGGGTGLGCLFDHPRAQTIHLLIDRVLNLGQGRVRVRRSPLRHGGKDVLSLCFPTFLQIFGLHLGLLSSWLLGQLLFVSVPSPGSSTPYFSSKQAAQKNEPHPINYTLL